MGAYCSVYNDTNDVMYIKYGANMGALRWAGIAAAIATAIAGGGAASAALAGAVASRAATAGAGLTLAGLEIAKEVLDSELKNDGYSAIKPGGTYKSDKLSCSLILQADIVLKGARGVRRGTLDVWTGPTDNSCNRYNASKARYQFTPF